jgi:hypothetical protein
VATFKEEQFLTHNYEVLSALEKIGPVPKSDQGVKSSLEKTAEG